MADYMNTLSSFSGSDLVVSFGSVVIGELQSLSWGVQREKAPIYTLGSPDVRSFSRGKRGIAGQLHFAVFDRDSVVAEMRKQFKARHDFPTMFTAAGNSAAAARTKFDEFLSMTDWDNRTMNYPAAISANTAAGGDNTAPPQGISTLGQPSGVTIADITTKYGGSGALDYQYNKQKQVAVPYGFDLITPDTLMYADTLPPFDITCTFANEFGQAAFMRILDVDILNDGSGVSVDTVVMERALTYIARRISPITSGVYVSSLGSDGKTMVGSVYDPAGNKIDTTQPANYGAGR